VASAEFPDCAVVRSPCWPASAASTTPCLERGNLGGVSDSVLDAVANAVQLDEAERNHLFDLARAAGRPTTKPATKQSMPKRVRPVVQRLLDAMAGAPAFVRNARLDILAANALGYALHSQVFVDPARPANLARFAFLDPRAKTFYPDWDVTASNSVALLRTEAGRNPYDKGLTDLVGQLSTRSEEFRTPLGRAQRAAAPHRSQTLPAPRRRSPRPGLRGPRPVRRLRSDPHRLQR
jgi:hypothetical protein